MKLIKYLRVEVNGKTKLECEEVFKLISCYHDTKVEVIEEGVIKCNSKRKKNPRI